MKLIWIQCNKFYGTFISYSEIVSTDLFIWTFFCNLYWTVIILVIKKCSWTISLDKTLESEVELEQGGSDCEGVVDVVVGRVLHEDDRLQFITSCLDYLTGYFSQLKFKNKVYYIIKNKIIQCHKRKMKKLRYFIHQISKLTFLVSGLINNYNIWSM